MDEDPEFFPPTVYPITRSIYPGGEINIEVPETPLSGTNRVTLVARVENASAVMALLLAAEVLKSRKCTTTLVLPYIPYARQDRRDIPARAHSLRVFAGLLNSCGFEDVWCLDPHSTVSEALIPNLKKLSLRPYIDYCVTQFRPDVFILPDAGSLTRYYNVLSKRGIEMITAFKHRDSKTGEITGVNINATEEQIKDKRILIVDDICDGGRTFIELVQAFSPYNPSAVGLFTTHGIFSKGLEPLRNAGISYVTATNSVREIPGITIPIFIPQHVYTH